MGRSPCCEKAHTNKGAWTKEEDQRLINYIRLHGEGCWRSLPKAAGLLRCGKSCRLRWINYLRPDLKRGNFTEEEDELIIKLHSLLGNKWSLIASRLPGRTDNEIKNYWNTHIKRKLISQGLDPQTHYPLTATNTTTATANICLDFRNNPPPSSPASDKTLPGQHSRVKLESDSAEEGKCNSGTTEEITHPQQPCRNDRNALDLNLSIGLPSQDESGNNTSAKSVDSSPFVIVGQPGVCLCFQLGLQKGQVCGNCGQNKNGFLRYC
ncbi:hypothetical protein LguiB_009781 [Lonicera macranthoides]